MDIRDLEDLLCSGPKGSRSNAVAAPNPKRKTRPRGGAGGDNGGIKTKKRPWKRAGAASGPFSGLSLCVVRLGSVTNNTVGTLPREFRDGGGQVSTHYTPGDTTHIVADASLAASWEKFDLYFSGWDDFEDVVDGAATAGRGRMPDGVPVVSSEWMSECLRRSEVVAADAYRLTPPPHRCVAPAAVAPTQQQRQEEGVDIGGRGDHRWSRGDEKPAGGRGGGKRVGLKRRGGIDEFGGGGWPQEARRGQETSVSRATEHFLAAPVTEQGSRRYVGRPGRALRDARGDGSVFNERGFKSAAATLRMLGTQITDIEQLKETSERGSRPFLPRARARRSPVSEVDPPTVEACLKLFQEVGWVGAVKTQQLYDKGMRSIENLRTRGRHLLTEQVRFCLNRHEDIKPRMPRSEAAEIEAAVTKVAQSICPGVICQASFLTSPRRRTEACGSYRRVKRNCGDVDVLIRPPEGQEDSSMFLELVKELTETRLITDRLAVPEGPYTPGKPQTFMGVCKLPGEGRLHRRLDIKLYPASMFAFAVLYFAGSGDFNMNMRCFGKSKGLKLNDKGLFKVDPFSGEEVPNSGYSCFREEDVFTALGMDWIEPKDRKGVGLASHNQQEALLQHQAIPMAEASLWSLRAYTAGSYYENAEQQMQQQQQMIMIQQQAEMFFRKEDQVQQAIRLSRGVFDAGGASIAAAGAGGLGRRSQRRCVADTRFAVGGGEREVVAGGSGSNATAVSSAEGTNGVGTGNEHSPVYL
ncbi:unnamed protein product [Ectocarpus sp. CCAP 1310/34]|nr:unnamed protein product [Ectocarpus sp. CCAP 1310/34]